MKLSKDDAAAFASWDADRASPTETADMHAGLHKLVRCFGPADQESRRPDPGATNSPGGDQARGVEYGFYRTRPWPDSWGPPEGSAHSKQRLDWIRSHLASPGEIYQRTLTQKATRYLAIARHAERIAELNARRDAW